MPGRAARAARVAARVHRSKVPVAAHVHRSKVLAGPAIGRPAA
jgi:hypothetical protein